MITVAMPPKSTNKDAKKRTKAGPSSPNKRPRGTASQPINVDSQQPSQSPPSPSPPPPPPPITNILQALASASQAPTFEARVRESRPEDTIVAPAEGSEQATAAASEAPEDKEDKETDAFNAYLIDNYNSLDWACLKKYMRPLATYKFKKS
jgi:hypothetical protein